MSAQNNGSILLKLGLILVVLVAAGFAVSHQLQATARVKPVNRDTATDAVTGTVRVDADGGVRELKSEASGKVVWCDAIGQTKHFKKGEVLVRLDTSDLKTSLEEMERNYHYNKTRSRFLLTGGKPERLGKTAKLSEAEREELIHELNPERKLAFQKLQNYERLHKLGTISDDDLRGVQRALDTIDQNLKMQALDEKKAEDDFQAQRAAILLQIDRMTLKAPFDGQVHLPLTFQGALVNAGQPLLLAIADERVVAAKITEEDFGKVRPGQRARLRLLTYGEKHYNAKISKLHPVADDAQRFTVFLDVEAGLEELLPASTGEVTITVDERPDQVVIPRRALFDLDQVFVVRNGRVQRRQVKVGYLALNAAEILEGLEVGEHVIVDRLEEFRDGHRVRIEIVN